MDQWGKGSGLGQKQISSHISRKWYIYKSSRNAFNSFWEWTSGAKLRITRSGDLLAINRPGYHNFFLWSSGGILRLASPLFCWDHNSIIGYNFATLLNWTKESKKCKTVTLQWNGCMCHRPCTRQVNIYPLTSWPSQGVIGTSDYRGKLVCINLH